MGRGRVGWEGLGWAGIWVGLGWDGTGWGEVRCDGAGWGQVGYGIWDGMGYGTGWEGLSGQVSHAQLTRTPSCSAQVQTRSGRSPSRQRFSHQVHPRVVQQRNHESPTQNTRVHGGSWGYASTVQAARVNPVGITAGAPQRFEPPGRYEMLRVVVDLAALACNRTFRGGEQTRPVALRLHCEPNEGAESLTSPPSRRGG